MASLLRLVAKQTRTFFGGLLIADLCTLRHSSNLFVPVIKTFLLSPIKFELALPHAKK